MPLLNLQINQELYPCSETFPVIDPSTGERFADAPNAGQEELNAAVSAAQGAAPAAAARDPRAARTATSRGQPVARRRQGRR